MSISPSPSNVEQAPDLGTAERTAARRRARSILNWTIAGIGILASILVAILTEGPSLWGLVPIVLYVVLAVMGMSLMLATVVALVSALIQARPDLSVTGEILVGSVTDTVTTIGLIIVLGAAVGGILQVTGVARNIVAAIMKVTAHRGPVVMSLGVMLACLVLVTSLGTLAGALAIAAPLIIPVAAKLGFTKSATASMMFIGGCAGLALAPFAGSNVAIMQAAEVGYLDYLLSGAGPLAILSLIVGAFFVPWMQKRSLRAGDLYSDQDVPADAPVTRGRPRLATAVFLTALALSVIYATINSAGTTFPLIALPILTVVTAIASGLPAKELLLAFWRGARSMFGMFVLFWVLGLLFAVIDILQPFQVVLDLMGPQLGEASPFAFTVLIALLGWVGVPGATAAQVVLLNEVFGGIAAQIGVPVGAWIIVLLFASKADTYGPFPNANMVGSMGLAGSKNLKNMMITGWALLVPCCVMYLAILFLQTR